MLNTKPNSFAINIAFPVFISTGITFTIIGTIIIIFAHKQIDNNTIITWYILGTITEFISMLSYFIAYLAKYKPDKFRSIAI